MVSIKVLLRTYSGKNRAYPFNITEFDFDEGLILSIEMSGHAGSDMITVQMR